MIPIFTNPDQAEWENTDIHKKKPPAVCRGLLSFGTCTPDDSAAAGPTRPAGTGTGTCAAQRHGRGNRKSGTGAGIDKIHLDLATVGDQAFVHQEFKTIDIVGLIIFLWLIQSQAQ